VTSKKKWDPERRIRNGKGRGEKGKRALVRWLNNVITVGDQERDGGEPSCGQTGGEELKPYRKGEKRGV